MTNARLTLSHVQTHMMCHKGNGALAACMASQPAAVNNSRHCKQFTLMTCHSAIYMLLSHCWHSRRQSYDIKMAINMSKQQAKQSVHMQVLSVACTHRVKLYASLTASM